MAPNFIERMRERGIADEPPAENPNLTASVSWEHLRDYAIKALSLAQDTNEINNMLTAENGSLRRENERQAAEIASLSRELRAANAFAQAMRTRATSFMEQFEGMERDAIQAARAAMPEPEVKPALRQIETAMVEPERIRRQVRANGGTMPPENSWPAANA